MTRRPVIVYPPARPVRPEDRAALVRALALVLIRAAVVPSSPPPLLAPLPDPERGS